MKTTNVAPLLNDTVREDLGLEAVLNEDLSNVVDFGRAIFDNSNTNTDSFCRALINRIGRTIFVNRTYEGNSLALYRNSFEYGSILQKITLNSIPESEANPTWDLQDGQSYDPFVFRKPDVSQKFFDEHDDFQVPLSVTDVQLRSAFLTPEALSSFVAMLWDGVDKSMALKLEALATRTVTSFISKTFANEFPEVADNDYSGMSGVKAINLLYLYNTQFGLTGVDALTPGNCLYNTEFLKFAVKQIDLVISRLTKMSSLFNIGAKPRFTPRDMQTIIMLSEFKNSADIYLQSGVFHDIYTRLPNATEVPYWQGSGTDYSFESTSKVHNQIKVGNTTKEMEIGYVLAVACDRDSCGVYQERRNTTSQYNAVGEYTNYFAKYICGMFADENENFVVFYVQ